MKVVLNLKQYYLKKTTNKNNQNQQVNITPCNGRFCDPALVSL